MRARLALLWCVGLGAVLGVGVAVSGRAAAAEVGAAAAARALARVDASCQRGTLEPTRGRRGGFVQSCQLGERRQRFYFLQLGGAGDDPGHDDDDGKAHVWRLLEANVVDSSVGAQSLSVSYEEAGRQWQASWFFGRGRPAAPTLGRAGTPVCVGDAYNGTLASGLVTPAFARDASGATSVSQERLSCGQDGVYGWLSASGLVIPTREVAAWEAEPHDLVTVRSPAGPVRFEVSAQRNRAARALRLRLRPVGDAGQQHGTFEIRLAPAPPDLSCAALAKLKWSCNAAAEPQPATLRIAVSGDEPVRLVAEPPARAQSAALTRANGALELDLRAELFAAAESGLVVSYRDDATGVTAASANRARHGWSQLAVAPAFPTLPLVERVVRWK